MVCKNFLYFRQYSLLWCYNKFILSVVKHYNIFLTHPRATQGLWLIDWCTTPTLAVFQLYRGLQDLWVFNINWCLSYFKLTISILVFLTQIFKYNGKINIQKSRLISHYITRWCFQFDSTDLVTHQISDRNEIITNKLSICQFSHVDINYIV
jgi:hypothetical protein